MSLTGRLVVGVAADRQLPAHLRLSRLRLAAAEALETGGEGSEESARSDLGSKQNQMRQSKRQRGFCEMPMRPIRHVRLEIAAAYRQLELKPASYARAAASKHLGSVF